MQPVARHLGIPQSHVICNHIFFQNGVYSGFARECVINQPNGKSKAIASILQGTRQQRCVMIGDGMTDCETEDVVDAFICYCGVKERQPVMERASLVVSNFHDLLQLYNTSTVCSTKSPQVKRTGTETPSDHGRGSLQTRYEAHRVLVEQCAPVLVLFHHDSTDHGKG